MYRKNTTRHLFLLAQSRKSLNKLNTSKSNFTECIRIYIQGILPKSRIRIQGKSNRREKIRKLEI